MFKKLGLSSVVSLVGLLGLSNSSNAATVTRVYDNFLIPDAQVKITFDINSSNLLNSSFQDQNNSNPNDDFTNETYGNVNYLVEYSGFTDGTLYFTDDTGIEVATDITKMLDGSGSFSSVGAYSHVLDYSGDLAYEAVSFGEFEKGLQAFTYYDTYTNIFPEVTPRQYTQFYEGVYDSSGDPIHTVQDTSFSEANVNVHQYLKREFDDGWLTSQLDVYSTPNEIIVNDITVQTQDYQFWRNGTSGAYSFVPDEGEEPKTTPEPGLLFGLVAIAGSAAVIKKKIKV